MPENFPTFIQCDQPTTWLESCHELRDLPEKPEGLQYPYERCGEKWIKPSSRCWTESPEGPAEAPLGKDLRMGRTSKAGHHVTGSAVKSGSTVDGHGGFLHGLQQVPCFFLCSATG